jgi:nitrogen-specific signal transduction histidine kinase
MSEQLRASEKRLLEAQKMEALGILAGGVAHDFNNILAAILCSADVLLHDLRRLPNSGELPEIVFELQTAAQRGTDLVRQILTFSRHAKKRRATLDPAETMQESIDLLKKICPANIDIRLSIQSHPFVLADATQLQQVLMNLGTNSFHALENTKGFVSFELNGVVIDAATAQTKVGLRGGSYAQIRVTDDGSGMDADTLEHLFEPFFTTKHDGKGTGLGMSVVRGIVTAHEGSIRVQSTMGQGTTVDLWFPAVPGVVNMVEGKKAIILQGKSEHVLVIDDEVSLARIFGRVLQSIGYRVTVETDSAKALEIIQKDSSSFNVALIDLHMPPPGGIEVAQRLHELRPDLPIFIMSGFSDALGGTLPPDSGIVGILQKPVTRETLATELRRALDSVATT